MTSYLLLVAVVLGVNLMPVLGPPTWLVLVLFRLPTDRALVGVWPAGDAQRLVTTTGGVRSVSVAAIVLDYAFEAGGEAELEALLRAWCGWLAPRGMDTLVIYSSPGSPGSRLLTGLARTTEQFFMWTTGIDVPPGAETRGLYTDAVYF